MEKQHFPKWKYQKKHGSKVVNDVEQEEALGDEWVDSPADFSEDEEQQPDANEETTRRGGNKRK